MKGWNGPYLSYDRIDYRDFKTGVYGLTVRVYRYKKNGWDVSESVNPPACNGVDSCYDYLVLDGVDEASSKNIVELFNAMDEKFDNSDGPSEGLVRKRAYDVLTNQNIYFQGVMRLDK